MSSGILDIRDICAEFRFYPPSPPIVGWPPLVSSWNHGQYSVQTSLGANNKRSWIYFYSSWRHPRRAGSASHASRCSTRGCSLVDSTVYCQDCCSVCGPIYNAACYAVRHRSNSEKVYDAVSLPSSGHFLDPLLQITNWNTTARPFNIIFVADETPLPVTAINPGK